MEDFELKRRSLHPGNLPAIQRIKGYNRKQLLNNS